MIADRLERLEEVVPGERWAQVAVFLRGLTAQTADGEYGIDGAAAYARVMSYETLPAAEVKLEAHRQYIDLQMTLSGCEGIDVFAGDLPVTQAYDEVRDIEFFSGAEAKPLACVSNRPGYFLVLFPQDIHRPKVRVAGEAAQVKKVVVKVRIDAL